MITMDLNDSDEVINFSKDVFNFNQSTFLNIPTQKFKSCMSNFSFLPANQPKLE